MMHMKFEIEFEIHQTRKIVIDADTKEAAEASLGSDFPECCSDDVSEYKLWSLYYTILNTKQVGG
jgi:hypothetical protein